jgi:hypothetical protein
MEGEPVDFHDQESGQQEVHPADAWKLHLGFEVDAVGPEQVLRVDFHDGLRA